MAVKFFMPFSFIVFKSVIYIKDFVHGLKNGSLYEGLLFYDKQMNPVG